MSGIEAILGKCSKLDPFSDLPEWLAQNLLFPFNMAISLLNGKNFCSINGTSRPQVETYEPRGSSIRRFDRMAVEPAEEADFGDNQV